MASPVAGSLWAEVEMRIASARRAEDRRLPRIDKLSISLVAEVVQDGIDEGSIRPVDPEQVAAVLFAAGHALFNQADHPYEELSNVLADIAIRGLQGRPNRRAKKRARQRT